MNKIRVDLEFYEKQRNKINPNYGVKINYNKIKKFIYEQFQKN